jgi:GNAT superfamily N-acetyltransferase
VKPEFRALGKRFGARTQAVAAAVRAADPARLATTVAGGASFPLAVPGLGTVEIAAEDVIVTEAPASGWGVASAYGETVALDLAVTPALRAEGLAREVIRRVQEARKAAGLAVTDRIALRWTAVPDATDLTAALAAHRELVAGEVLAVTFGPGIPGELSAATVTRGPDGRDGTSGTSGAGTEASAEAGAGRGSHEAARASEAAGLNAEAGAGTDPGAGTGTEDGAAAEGRAGAARDENWSEHEANDLGFRFWLTRVPG